MGLSILSNIPSLAAQNQLAMTNTNLQNTLFQLSSGSKINSGADDPAGLSIADGLQANISALTQSAQNVTDGVGLLQTADGALSQVTTLLNRAVTLATEASNSGLTGDQQTALQNEFTSISNEISQIGQNTTYNSSAVFTGAAMQVFLSDGSTVDANSASGPTISVNMPTLSPTALGFGTTASATLVLTANPAAADTLTIGSDIYTFVAAGNAANANDVVIGNNVQDTLENLQSAVAGTPSDVGSTIGTGTVANPLATITWVNGGSAEIQATTPGTGTVGAGTGNFVAVGLNLATAADGTIATSNAGFLGGGVAGVDLSSANDAATALTSIESAIATVAADRGAIGSGINQMNAAVNVMNNTSQNLTSSLSGIQDANMGQVVANMSKYQVLEQTGIAALAQSNQQEQAVLKLLQ
jgi:flagellin